MPVPTNQAPLPTLASQPLPRRVRELLGSVLKIAAEELSRPVAAAIKDFEQQVHRLADSTVDNAARAGWGRAQEAFVDARRDFLLNFTNALEAELANLQSPKVLRGHLQVSLATGMEMALVNDLDIEETSILADAASRAELQCSLPLFLLGQRFGVLAGRPAFDAEMLPLGPQALCRSIRRAIDQLGLEQAYRPQFYRAFERQVMPTLSGLVGVINADLARNGVLPHLQYVPVRARRSEQTPVAATAGNPRASAAGTGADGPARGRPGGRAGADDPVARRQTEVARQAAQILQAMAEGRSDELVNEKGFDVLRQLLVGRRQLLGKLNPDRGKEEREAAHQVGATDLQEALRSLQNRPPSPVMSHGRVAPRNVGHIKQDLLALLRRVSPNDAAPALAAEHNDALDLLGMLSDNLMKAVKPDSNVAGLLSKMQIPMMRVALQDSRFFTEPAHPARQMLNTIVETGGQWLDGDEAEPTLLHQMHAMVDHAAKEYRGDPTVFKNMLQELGSHLQTLSRKAEVAERRHVDAARGKEKLTLARQHAARAMDALVNGQKLPRFTRTMLNEAWTDVMALTQLRQGEDSVAWRRQLAIAQRLVQIAQHPGDDHAAEALAVEEPLQAEIEEALSRVGYQGDDLTAIAQRLVHPNSANKDDASSRTELTMRLKARARLGEDMSEKLSRRLPLTSLEQAAMQRLQQTPVGTWFEFVLNPQGDRTRRRLSWLSTATGEALFVNQRGQKNAEYTLETLARLLAKGQVSLVEGDAGTVLDRAWENVLHALQSFAVPAAAGESRP